MPERVGSLDFDDDSPLNLLQSALALSRSTHMLRVNRATKDYRLFHSMHKMVGRNRNLPNVFLPMIRGIVRDKAYREIRAVLSRRPWIPFDAKREEFKQIAKLQVQLLDDMLEHGGFRNQVALAILMKTALGTAFVEPKPEFVPVQQPILVDDKIGGMVVGQKIDHQVVWRLRLKVTTYGLWEVVLDPHWRGLEDVSQCRYAITIRLVSRRQIREAAERGAYPQLKESQLDAAMSPRSGERRHLYGYQLLNEIGLNQPRLDDDMGVYMEFKSPKRYFDIWQDTVELRDGPNPYTHGRINLARITHHSDIHTQNQGYGIGEAKDNEMLSSALNDALNMALLNHQSQIQGRTYFDSRLGVNEKRMQNTLATAIPVELKTGDHIGNRIQHYPGQSLPQGHFTIIDLLSRHLDKSARNFGPQRGEPDQVRKTATETAFLAESGDIPQEYLVTATEDVFTKPFARLCLHHISQFATWEDKVEILGPDEAGQLITAAPWDLPGSYNWAIRGSDEVVNRAVQQANWLKLADILLRIPNVLPGWIAKQLLERTDLGDIDIDEGVMPDNLMQFLQGMAQQVALQNQGALQQARGGNPDINAPSGSAGGGSGFGPSIVNPERLAQSGAQDIRRAVA